MSMGPSRKKKHTYRAEMTNTCSAQILTMLQLLLPFDIFVICLMIYLKSSISRGPDQDIGKGNIIPNNKHHEEFSENL